MSKQPDTVRSYYLYRYLLGCLAVSRRSDGTSISTQTAERVGDKELRKVLPAVLSGEDAWENAVSASRKKVTTGRVVDMLGTLRETLNQDYRAHEEPYSRVLTTEDILTALYQLVELTPDERARLGLPAGDTLTLLKQTLLSLQARSGTQSTENFEAIFNTYKEAVGLEFTSNSETVTTFDQVNDLIETSVRAVLSYLPSRKSKYHNNQKQEQSSENTIAELTKKAQREVRRLLVRSGNTQPFWIDRTAEHPYIKDYLQPAFIKKLAQTVVKNERLTATLPVFLKQLTVEVCGPLPFFDNSLGSYKFGSSYPELLHERLKGLDGNAEHLLTGDIPVPSDYELASQEAVRISLGFYIKVPVDYQNITQHTFKTLTSENAQGKHPYRRVDFVYSSTGVGGTLSHVVKLINKTLLSDIRCLDSFFPIAHDVTSTQTIVRDNVSSPIWAHSLVKLCHNRSVGKALRAFDDKQSSYDNFSFGDSIGHGDFCGFDFLIAQAQSAVQARLQAIHSTGVYPSEYIKQLCEKVEREIALRRARQTVKTYPFSSMAMIGTVHRAVIGDELKDKDSVNRNLHENDLSIYFDALLSIAETLLDEGAYKASYFNLRRLSILDTYAKNSLDQIGDADIDSDSYRVFSSRLVVRYLICKATYYYLFDLRDRLPESLQQEFSAQPSRQELVDKAWDALYLAEAHIKDRLKKYMVIGEVSQGTFHPHYKLLGRIYLLRARLLTFFPLLVKKSEDILPTENFSGQQRTNASVHWGKLHLLEKARLYVAADGDSESYACYAALQSCYYLTVAYENPQNTEVSLSKLGESRTLERDNCMMWARRLRDHALLTYAETGRRCYNAIKEKSGLPGTFDKHGRYSIEKLPAIFEDRGLQRDRAHSEDNDFLTLDISLLAISSRDLPKLTANLQDESIYLFGTNTAHLFLARGLYLLCSDTTEEFEKNEPPGQIQWDRKLQLARRLFDMAWAIAEDGCSIKRKGKQKIITRSFKASESPEQYSTRETNSIRDLYPRRINEIADIGKMFSAACMTLQLHLLPEEDRADTFGNISKLFGMFHGSYRLAENKLLRALLQRQKRYNGHLETFLESAIAVINSHQPISSQSASKEEMATYRDALMTELFSVLMK